MNEWHPWMFRICRPGYVNREEWQQARAIADTGQCRWKVTCVRLAVEAQVVDAERHLSLCDGRLWLRSLCWPESAVLHLSDTGGVHCPHCTDLTVFTSKRWAMQSHGLQTKYLSNVQDLWLSQWNRLSCKPISRRLRLQHVRSYWAGSCI